jgi:hypothetical protein
LAVGQPTAVSTVGAGRLKRSLPPYGTMYSQRKET